MDLIEQLRNYLEGVEWNGPADAFYEHAVQARSQYDEQYRAMATEILAARKAIRRAADALTGQEGAAPSPRAAIGPCRNGMPHHGNLFAWRGFAQIRTAPGKNTPKSADEDRLRTISLYDVVFVR